MALVYSVIILACTFTARVRELISREETASCLYRYRERGLRRTAERKGDGIEALTGRSKPFVSEGRRDPPSSHR
ncbi:hypothetical protein LZ31DRAFT_550810 [Colletotrichum somersetense]|nr:hypothetical protein LZ31DRAFT_550810 [Colletotrichum somersetense]